MQTLIPPGTRHSRCIMVANFARIVHRYGVRILDADESAIATPKSISAPGSRIYLKINQRNRFSPSILAMVGREGWGYIITDRIIIIQSHKRQCSQSAFSAANYGRRPSALLTATMVCVVVVVAAAALRSSMANEHVGVRMQRLMTELYFNHNRLPAGGELLRWQPGSSEWHHQEYGIVEYLGFSVLSAIPVGIFSPES